MGNARLPSFNRCYNFKKTQRMSNHTLLEECTLSDLRPLSNSCAVFCSYRRPFPRAQDNQKHSGRKPFENCIILWPWFSKWKSHLRLIAEGSVIELQPAKSFSKIIEVICISGEQPTEYHWLCLLITCIESCRKSFSLMVCDCDQQNNLGSCCKLLSHVDVGPQQRIAGLQEGSSSTVFVAFQGWNNLVELGLRHFSWRWLCHPHVHLPLIWLRLQNIPPPPQSADPPAQQSTRTMIWKRIGYQALRPAINQNPWLSANKWHWGESLEGW